MLWFGNAGVLYLYMKTIERAHMPNKLWERVKLPRNYLQALGIIDKHLVLDFFSCSFILNGLNSELNIDLLVFVTDVSLKLSDVLAEISRAQDKAAADQDDSNAHTDEEARFKN